jgi:hypothetical protein
VELRILRFRHVHDVSILNEKVFSFLRMRQLLYFAFGILILWRAMSFKDPGALAFSMFVFLLGMASAILSKGSCSFEARIVLTIMSIIDSLLTPKTPKAVPARPRKPIARHSPTSTSNIFLSRVLKSKALNVVVTATGFTMFALSTLTLLGCRTPLTPLGSLGLAILASTSATIGFAGMFMLLSGTLGNPFRGVRR